MSETSRLDLSQIRLRKYCPVLKNAEEVIHLSGNLKQAIHKLKKSRRLCEQCSHFESCQIWEDFNHQVDTAIREINLEWDMR